MRRVALCGIVLFALTWFVASPAHAQLSRTWVSGVGDDVNPCSRTAPCRTFAAAMGKTLAGGEINCLDPGSFGGATIGKSITIDCSGTFASVSASGFNGITVNGAGIAVTLRGISLDGTGGQGLSAIRVQAGSSLLIENVHIFGFGAGTVPAPAVDIEPNQAPNLLLEIKDTTISNNAGGAILIKPVGGGTTIATLTRVNIYTSEFGLRAEDGAKVTVINGVAANNLKNGYLAVSATNPSEVNLIDAVTAGNATNGVATSGAGATIRLVRSTIVDNATGIDTAMLGTVVGTSPASTLNAGNSTNGAPNGTALPLQ